MYIGFHVESALSSPWPKIFSGPVFLEGSRPPRRGLKDCRVRIYWFVSVDFDEV